MTTTDNIEMSSISKKLEPIKLHKKPFFLILIAILTSVVSLSFILEKKYKSEIVISPAGDEKSSNPIGALASQYGAAAELAGISLGGGSSAKEQNLAFLKSRGFREDFIKTNNLLPTLFYKRWDDDKKDWKTDNPDKVPTLYDGQRLLEKAIIINSDKKSAIININFTWKDRQAGPEILNNYVKLANKRLREKAIADSELAIGYLEEELKKTSSTEVQLTIYRLMESQIKAKTVANTQEQFAFKIIDFATPVSKKAFVSPNRLAMALGGLIGGLFAAYAFVYIKTRRLEKSSSSKDIISPQ